MSRVVFINGFGNGRSSTERVANALENHYENIEAFRFSDLNSSPDAVRKASAGADVITHSAGALGLKLESMDQANSNLLLGPPLPQRVSRLLYRTVVKTARMNTPGVNIHNFADFQSANQYSASSLAELAANPIDNFGRLDEIARTHSVYTAIRAVREGTPTKMVWTQQDAYFQPTSADLEIARMHDIPTVTNLHGEHDEVVLRPEEFLEKVLS